MKASRFDVLPAAVLAVVSGLALSASFEPVALPVLLPFALAGFALATDGVGRQRGRTSVLRAGFVGWCFGVAFFFTHIAWMRASIGPDAWIALATIESVAYGVVGAALPLVRRLPLWPLWAAAIWTTVEGVRSTWPFSGMPWGRVSFATIDTPLAHAVAYLGVTGLSFGIVLLGFCLAAWIGGPGPRAGQRGGTRLPAMTATVLVAAVLVAPALVPYPIETDPSAGRNAVVAAVQGDVPGPGNNILYDPRGVTENHVEATLGLAEEVAAGRSEQPDFAVWPENSTAMDPFADSEVNAGIVTAVEALGAPILVGGIVDDGSDHVLNQGIVWDPVTGPGDRYTKRHPVPYGEYIPFRDYWDPNFGQLALIRRDMKSGDRTEPIDIAGVAIGDAICFDVAYDDVLPAEVRDGAELLTVQTSNASFIFTHQIDQQFAMTRLRALESGRWLVVASTNGRSGIIGPDGAVIATADARTQAVLSAEVGLLDTITPAVRMGPWPERMFILLSLIGLVLGLLAYRRTREDAGSASRAAAVAEPTPTTNEAQTVERRG